MSQNRQQGGVVITGASSGIGEACALTLDKLGYLVFAGVRRQADADALKAKSSTLMPLMIDVTDGKSIAAAVEVVTQNLGANKLVGLINNAGITVAGPLEFLPLDD